MTKDHCRGAVAAKPSERTSSAQKSTGLGAAMKRSLLAASMLAVTSAGALAVPTYGLLTTIGVPTSGANVQPGGAFTAYDIGFVDPVTGNYYIADRSNASVDIFSGASNTFLGRATGFAGQGATTSVSGADGVVVVNSGGVATLYAGDGGSVLRSFNVTNPAAPIATGTVNTGGGALRVDEMAYSPTNKLLFTANNANSPAFSSLISTATPTAPALVKTAITVPTQTNPGGGLEQSVWNPTTGTFFVAVPQFGTTDSGGVQEFSTAGVALRAYNFTALGIAACGPSGLGLGASGNLMVGCSSVGSQTVILNPAGLGSIVTLIGSVSGTDELWYDPASGNYYVTGVAAGGDRVISIISDANYATLQTIDLTLLGAGKNNFHSVAVNPFNGEIFVPLNGTTAAFTDTLCPLGCIAVFGQNVPEPGTLPLIGAALTALGVWRGMSARRRKG